MMRNSLVPIIALSLLLPSTAFAGWEEGVAAFRSKDYQTAVQEFQTVVEQSPDAHSGHYMLGLALRGLNRKEEALNHLRKAYDLNPNDLSIKIELGQSYFQVRRYQDAAKLLGTVSKSESDKLDPRRKGAFYKMRAIARDKAGDEDAAFADYKVLAGLYPQDDQIQLKYGVLASARNDLGVALTAVDRAHRANSKDQVVKRTYVTLLKKQARIERDKSKKKQAYLKASNLAKELVALDGSHDNLLLACEVELGASLYAEAVGNCQKAASKKSNDWLSHYYLGQAFTSNKQYDEAVGPLDKAATLTSKPDEQKNIWRQLGFVYEKQKKYAASVEAYEKAGDASGVARVRENEATADENARIEAENARIEQMRKEAEELEKQLKELEGGGGR